MSTSNQQQQQMECKFCDLEDPKTPGKKPLIILQGKDPASGKWLPPKNVDGTEHKHLKKTKGFSPEEKEQLIRDVAEIKKLLKDNNDTLRNLYTAIMEG